MQDMKKVRALLRGNQRALVKRGFAPSDRIVLDLLSRNPGKSIAAIGRMAGMQRQNAHRAVKRLQAFGAVVRVGRLLCVFPGYVLKMSVEAAKERWLHMQKLLQEKRAARAKMLETLRENLNVINTTTHAEERYNNNASATVVDDRLASQLEKEGDWGALAALWSRQMEVRS